MDLSQIFSGMFKTMDLNGDGRISFHEFLTFVKKQYEEVLSILQSFIE